MVYIINYIYVAVPFRMSGSTPVIDGEHVQAYTIGTIRNKINAIININAKLSLFGYFTLTFFTNIILNLFSSMFLFIKIKKILIIV